MRPADKARRPRIPSVFEGGVTPSDGMQRRSNAAGLSPRAARSDLELALDELQHFRQLGIHEVTAVGELEVLASQLRGHKASFGNRNTGVVNRIEDANPRLVLPNPLPLPWFTVVTARGFAG